MKIVALAGTAGLALTFGICIVAQQTGDPSAVIRIIREEIKQGRDAAHEMVEMGYVKTLAKAKYANYFALTTISGPSEAWFIEGFPSFDAMGTMRESVDKSAFKAELDKLDSEDGELRSGGRSILARYRKDLTYLGDHYKDARGRSHYASITMIRTRPGHMQEFARMRGILNEAFSKAGYDRPVLIYQVASGMPAGTFMAFNAMPTMKGMDPVEGGMTIPQAMGEDNMKEYNKLLAETMISSEQYTFAFSPKMSYVSDEVAAKDPAFWRPKK